MKSATDIIELLNLVCALEYKKSYSFRCCCVTRNHGYKCSYVSAGLAAHPVTFSVNTSYDSGSLKRNKSLRWFSFVASFDFIPYLVMTPSQRARQGREEARDAKRRTAGERFQLHSKQRHTYSYMYICILKTNKQKRYPGAMVIPCFTKFNLFTFLLNSSIL